MVKLHPIDILALVACIVFGLWAWDMLSRDYTDALSTCLERYSVDTCIHSLR